MAVERSELVGIALEQFKHYSDRLVSYLAAGFIIGFVIGLGAAWTLMHVWLE
jgi:hypothetical protein